MKLLFSMPKFNLSKANEMEGTNYLMLNIEITETRDFVKKLLIDSTFDTFLLVEANVKSDVAYHISGHINTDFYDSDELEQLPSAQYATWGKLRPHIYNVIKGKKLPLSFKIVLILSPANVTRIIEKNNLPLSVNDVANLSLNIYYDGSKITATTIASLKTFSMDKTLENLWDENVAAYFKREGIF